jgi:glycosyltransferase involved in cell wall biosynthesis
MTLVSIVIPCYNSEAFVRRAIDCALSQTHLNCEIILVDNNSSDGTLAILESVASQHPDRVSVFQEAKRGAPAARNKGLAEAKGEWIQFLDSDDEILPDKIAHQMQVAVSSAYDLIVGNRIKQKFRNGELEKRTLNADTANVWKALIESKLNSTSAMLWKKKTLLDVNGWNEKWIYSSDEYELIFRMLQNDARVGFCDAIETIVHAREESVNRSTDDEKLTKILSSSVRLRCDIHNYLKASGKLTKELDQAFKRKIYSRLRPYKSRLPDFVNSQFKQLHIHVPVDHVIRVNIRRLKKLITGK